MLTPFLMGLVGRQRSIVSYEQPSSWVHEFNEDILFTIAHGLRYDGCEVTCQTDHLVTTADQHQKIGGNL
jgi:hypothetical protein